MPARAQPEPRHVGALEIRGTGDGLLDEPLALRVRGAGPEAELTWRARYRDDDDRIWRASAAHAGELISRWMPAKESTGAIAALRSLRPLSIEVRAELPDGRAAERTLTRRLVADGVRVRRWRDGLAATLHVPAGPACATVVVDATGGPAHETAALLAAPLLAARGVLALVVVASRGVADPLEAARERLQTVPAAARAPIVALPAIDPFGELAGDGVVLPPGVGARDGGPHVAAARAAAWDALLARLGATPREQGGMSPNRA